MNIRFTAKEAGITALLRYHSIAAFIVVAAVGAVCGIPGMRQGHAFPKGIVDACAIVAARVEFEFPAGIKIVFRPGKCFRGKLRGPGLHPFVGFLNCIPP